MAGTNEFAVFAVEAYVPGGGGGAVQNQAENKSKNAFRPVPVRKSTFPASLLRTANSERTSFCEPKFMKYPLVRGGIGCFREGEGIKFLLRGPFWIIQTKPHH